VSAADLILLVDDNEANGVLARAVLERDGYSVEVATSAPKAPASMGQMQPDLILMDLQLSGQHGLAFARQLRSDAATSQIPIVALTAYAMPADRQRALDAGCDGYISMPIDTRTLADEVRRFLERSRGRRQEGEAV
jgi:CheY-like chemotaxis protein